MSKDKDGVAEKILKNKALKNAALRKMRNGQTFLDPNEGAEWLASNTAELAKKATMNHKFITYADLLKGAKIELEDWIKSEGSTRGLRRIRSELERDIKESISDFVAKGILIMGFAMRCPSCNHNNWLQVENLQQITTCLGCGREYVVDVNPQVSYKLNPFVCDAFACHGAIPVFLTLGSLTQFTSLPFIVPSITIYRLKSKKPWRELDVACVIDGKLVIGEIKTTAKKMSKDDLKDMLDVAKIIKANKVILGALDNPPKSKTKSLQSVIDAESKLLTELGIQVEWCKLPDLLNRPSPHF